MNYLKRKLNAKTVVVHVFAVLALVLGSIPSSVNTAEAASGPSWFPLAFRLAVADEVKEEPVFTVPKPVAIKTMKMDVTAYTSSVEECDSDPFITADGSTTRDDIVATNVLPFGTKIRIPDYFGDKVFEVHDRMNKRYSYRVDVWMQEKGEMRKFGIKRNANIEILEMGDGSTQWGKKK
jgi:3D (Asp-Asp-Asp) domain-containing protein